MSSVSKKLRRADRSRLTHARLVDVFHYDLETGVWSRLRDARCGPTKAGMPVGSRNQDGYLQIQIDGLCFTSNVLAWFYVTRKWPTCLIDHKDRNTTNDRWNNLREANRTQNSANSNISSLNTTGYKGVSFEKRAQKYRVQISKGNRKTFHGYYKTAEQAHQAYKKAAQEKFGEFANV